ncbi:M23 family metallopeptidase [Rubrivirga sp. IMCC43871]|uniref:M23 family metallopeptidase n=1 Tax=Rubrivirga sp. IMCC43871 TaxID=3391575 RepID=UPI00398FF0A8
MLRLVACAALAAVLALPALAQGVPIPVRTVADAAPARSFSADRLLVPVEGMAPDDLDDTFTARRSGGRTHRAIDIMAPRGTPVLAISDGEIVRIHTNRLGGKVVYLRSYGGDYDFYYAHLDSYAPGLEVGQTVRQGDVLGTVGNTGNARSTPPHLHFQVLRRSGRGRGTPVNPYRLLEQSTLYGRAARG